MSENTERQQQPLWQTVGLNMFRIYVIFSMIRYLTAPSPVVDGQEKSIKKGEVESAWTKGPANLKLYMKTGQGQADILLEKQFIFGEAPFEFKDVIEFTLTDLKSEELPIHVRVSNEKGSNLEFDYKKRKVKKERLLLTTDSAEYSNADMQTEDWQIYLHTNFTIGYVDHIDLISINAIPPKVAEKIKINDQGQYLPIFFVHNFWTLKEDMQSVTQKTVKLYVEVVPMSLLKYQLYQQFQESMKMQESFGAGGNMDEVKRMLRDTNPYLLAVTVIVSLLHSLFDFLAFKNDVQFWRKKTNLEGISVRSMLLQFTFQIIIFLYLANEETSWVVLISSGVGLVIEFWKLKRAMNFEGISSFPFVRIVDKSSYVSKTKEYDAVAMRYLSYAAYPLLVGYAIYSLYYYPQTGWYSWFLKTLVGFIYTFGFIMMTPQLFINYKLKSVAHMPWRTFLYKALNTFVDDFFAFVIKMPTLHRLACFRDDLIFMVYLYQRWIYPVDNKRANEYGQVEETKEKAE